MTHFKLPELPYAENALAPYLSKDTIRAHRWHHAAYVATLNKLLPPPEEGEGKEKKRQKTLEEIIVTSDGGIFNSSAQAWSHNFYWWSMKPKGGGSPGGALRAQIEKDFGSVEKMLEEFILQAMTQFGSGWAWLCQKDGRVSIMKTMNADVPMRYKQHALLCIDVWEHAYYRDYEYKRPEYIRTFFDKLVNWEFAERNFVA